MKSVDVCEVNSLTSTSSATAVAEHSKCSAYNRVIRRCHTNLPVVQIWIHPMRDVYVTAHVDFAILMFIFMLLL